MIGAATLRAIISTAMHVACGVWCSKLFLLSSPCSKLTACRLIRISGNSDVHQQISFVMFPKCLTLYLQMLTPYRKFHAHTSLLSLRKPPTKVGIHTVAKHCVMQSHSLQQLSSNIFKHNLFALFIKGESECSETSAKPDQSLKAAKPKLVGQKKIITLLYP